MEIRQQSTAIESYKTDLESGKLAEMDQDVFNCIKQWFTPMTANQIYDFFCGMYLLPSITAAINRLRYDHQLIVGSKMAVKDVRKKLYYTVRTPDQDPDVRPLTEVDRLKLEIQQLKTEILQLKNKNKMLVNNFVIKK